MLLLVTESIHVSCVDKTDVNERMFAE